MGQRIEQDQATGERWLIDDVTGAVIETLALVQTAAQPIQPVTQPAANQTSTVGGIPVYVTPEGAAFPAVPSKEPEESAGGSSDYSGGYRSGGGYSGRSYGGGSQGGSSQGYAPRDPQYADGSFHSQYGGLDSLAGLGDRIRAANGQPPGGDEFRQQIYSPSGAGAGPFGASAPDAAGPDYGDRTFNAAGHPYSGGAGNTHPLYQALAAKGNAMEAKVRGMAAGIGSGGGGSYGGSSYGSTSSAAPKTAEPRMRGLAKGMDPTQAANIGLHPSFLLPELFPGLSGASPLYQSLADLPAAQLGMLTKGNWKGTPSSTVNAIGSVYQKVGNKNWFPSSDKMLANLARPGKGIEEMFGGVKAGRGDSESYTAPGYVYGQEPLNAAYAADQYGGLLDAALLPLPTETAMKYGSEGYGGYMIDRWGGKALKKPAGKGKPIYASVGRKLMR